MLMMTAAVRADPDAVLPFVAGGPRHRALRLALLAAWLLVAGWLAAQHVMWRDEVRAFTLSLTGDSVPAMLRGIHGEGHPALWYLLLRGADALIGRAALPVTAFAIGASAATLFVWRAPFRPAIVALALFGAFFVHEYTVVARNYGVAMLLMFAFAAAYPRWRERGIGLGLILALLCNTSVPAVMLAGALTLFWAVELWCTHGLHHRCWRTFAINAGLALLGVVACVAEVYPPVNDAAVSPLTDEHGFNALLAAVANVLPSFSFLIPAAWWDVPLVTLALAAMLLGTPLGLVRSPGGLIAGLAIAVAMPLFFQLVYPGSYRHQALFVACALTLYWLVAEGGGGRWPTWRPVLRPATVRVLQRGGQAAFAALLAAQVTIFAGIAWRTAEGVPDSRARDLAVLLRREGLGRAVVTGNPDVMLEALPFHAPNPVWLARERRWGHTVAFSKAAWRPMTLGELLPAARLIRARTGRPVVILLQIRLDPAAPPRRYVQGYLGAFSTTPGEVRAFLAGTRRLARFAPAATDESYDVYLLR